MNATPLILLATLLGLSATFASASDEREARIFAYYSTTSVTSLTTVTITGLSTCVSTTTAACLGRRKRAVFNTFAELENERDDQPINLDGSQGDDADEVPSRVERSLDGEERDDQGREGKRLTIWSTNFTTLTLTSTSVQPSTTVTASALCAAPGVTQGCFIG
ncbi:uncharacterized protein LOC125040160 [Penaeus chinensis]|uniref:uncharacterized protein LOC125040160 n=1 Tax=Penaeus chinensis TaxID=139456 RepID=UPI001FB6B9A7|nr:uncharacterized protein LOC125040160 [Penaeus chinensis]